MKTGIVSFAHLHANAYISHLLSMKEVEFIGIYDDDLPRGRAAAESYCVPFFDSLEAFFDTGVEAVVLCSENSRHRFFVEKAARAGCAVLCEKPLATTIEDGAAMVETCRSHSVPLMTAFPVRYSPPVKESFQRVREGNLGNIYCVSGKNQGQMPKRHREWFVDKELAGGGAMMDHIVHLADLLRWIFDDEVTEVYARANNILYDGEVDVETAGMVMLTFKSGRFASIDCSWSFPLHYPIWGGLSFELVGEKAILNVDAFRQNMTVYGGREQHSRLIPWGSDADALMLTDFIRSVENGTPVSITGEDGLRAVEIVEAAYRSWESGKPEKIRSMKS